ncbi:ABC-type iron(III)-siderophore transport system, permease component [Nautilia profundicola AmH]|uniref:ABC-type iron(III)-siderophore transport system, permease component n=1 Tax=Nautilia profundicola (strain ATCC BAA-1463 / DSM 18972 / AmH) TaxID=598659 RepID=B9L928_NAUPA|nr:iron ABC transporter permease [Nautilia profundicola]ACM93426.1 ABC-type iron(III)-siderophore transport system, permease component [Nautilia profundicola AmH]
MQDYIKLLQKNIFLTLFAFIVLIVIFILSVKTGEGNYTFSSIIDAFFNKNDEYFIIYEIRIPRSLAAVFVGASLGVAGLVMQYILKNPLASPFTLGISHGALFGASLSIVFFNSLYLALFAFIGANVVTFMILTLSRLRGFTPEVLILSGVAISALFGSGSMFLQYFADDLELSNIINWSFGDLSKAEYFSIGVLFTVFILAFIYFYIKKWDFNALDIVESENVGVNVRRLRLVSLLIATLLSAVSVAYFGIIGFIGLIAPHFARLLSGDFRFLLPLSAIIGAGLLLLSDIASRILLSPVELPVGILTSFIGAPLFLILLIKIYRK